MGVADWGGGHPFLLLSYQGTFNSTFFLGLGMIFPGGLALRTDLQLFLQALHSLGLVLVSGLYAARPWRYALKQIGGQFGSSVLSYFVFLKTLLTFNALMLLPLLGFLVGVQAAFPPNPTDPVPTCSGLELLTGRVRSSAPVVPSCARPVPVSLVGSCLFLDVPMSGFPSFWRPQERLRQCIGSQPVGHNNPFGDCISCVLITRYLHYDS